MKKVLLLLIFFSFLQYCKKDDYSYFDSYTGAWQFRVYRKSWNHLGYKYDTINYLGYITRIDHNRGLQIRYYENSFADVWVENDTIMHDLLKIGIIRDGKINFSFAQGTLHNGISDQITGTKQ
jgi:hypothetical protein